MIKARMNNGIDISGVTAALRDLIERSIQSTVGLGGDGGNSVARAYQLRAWDPQPSRPLASAPSEQPR